jgi:hypothetical protein
MMDRDGRISSASWILLYRASLSAYFGMGKCLVAVKAENGRIAAAYNEDDTPFVAANRSPNRKGFIISVAEDGGIREIFHRNEVGMGVINHLEIGPGRPGFGGVSN